MQEREKETHKRERRLALDNSAMSLKLAQLEGELAKTASDHQCEVDRNEHLKKMFNLMEMEKEALAERLGDLQKKLQNELEESTRRISIMENEVSEYQNQLRISMEEVAKSEREKKELQVNTKELEGRIAQVLEEKKQAEERVVSIEEDMARVANELKRLQADQESVLDDARAKAQIEVRRVQAEYESTHTELRARLQVAAAYERRSKDLELKTSLLEGEVKRSKEETVRAERRASEVDMSLRKSEAQNAGSGQVVSQLEAMLGKYKEEIKALERDKYEATKKAAELEGTLAKMRVCSNWC